LRSIFNHTFMRNIVKNRYRGFAMPLIALVVSMSLTGCQLLGPGTPAKPGEDIIREGMANLLKVNAYSYEVGVKGDLKDETDTPVKFDVTLGGQVDVKDAKDPKVTLKLAGTAGDGGEMSGDGSFDIRLNKQALYFNILKLDIKGAGDIPKEVTDMFSKWWMITLPEGTLDEMASSLPQADETKMTPEQVKVKKALEEANFFGKPTYVGVENVKGEDCYHYSVTLDKKALLTFMKTASEAQGTTVSDTEFADAEKSFEKIDVTGDVYVGVKTALIHQMSMTIKMNGGEGMPTGTVTASLKLWDVGKAVTFDAPKDATEFPVEDFISGFMGGMGAATTLDESATGIDTSSTTDTSTDSQAMPYGEDGLSG